MQMHNTLNTSDSLGLFRLGSPGGRILGVIALLIGIGILRYQLWFLRNPVRVANDDPTVFLSPAHGTITKIITRTDDEIPVEKKYATTFVTQTSDVVGTGSTIGGTLINIMMTPMNIHYQRAPMNARVIGQTYVPGKFMNAVSDAASLGAHFENERNEVLYESDSGVRFKIIQIAGYLARRIYSYVEVGQEVSSADTIGLISLGSQVSVIVPDDIQILVQEGDEVIDGETILGRHSE